MATLDVTGTPQAVYPDGFQSDITITNLGPNTVFLDQDSSISVDNSYPLPATGSITWQAGKPLWFLGQENGTSRVRITRNSSVHHAPKADISSTIYSSRQEARLGGYWLSDIIECGAYRTLDVDFTDNSLSTDLTENGTHYIVTVYWYNALDGAMRIGQPVGKTQFLTTFPYYHPDGCGILCTVPVKGQFCVIRLEPFNGFPGLYVTGKVSASTMDKRKGWVWYNKSVQFGSFGPGSELYTNQPATTFFTALMSTGDTGINNGDDIAIYEAWDAKSPGYDRIVVAPVGKPFLNISYRVQGTSTSAALLRIAALYGQFATLETLSIPAGASATANVAVRVPTTVPVEILSASSPAGATSVTISMYHSDN